MKKILLVALMGLTMAAYSQQSKIYIVNTVKVKSGERMEFEAAYKKHVAMFHKTQKISVYEIMSGPSVGSYQIVSGPSTYADIDNERADATAHGVDLDKNYFKYLENDRSTNYFRLEDSLSFHGDVQSEKTVINVRHIKEGMQTDYFNEEKRSFKVLHLMKGKFWDNLNLRNYSQLWDGSDHVMVTVRTLKDGFKELEQGYFGQASDGNPTFKDVYIQQYGTLDWDKRTKLLEEARLSTEQYIRKRRTDLSSQ